MIGHYSMLLPVYGYQPCLHNTLRGYYVNKERELRASSRSAAAILKRVAMTIKPLLWQFSTNALKLGEWAWPVGLVQFARARVNKKRA